MSRRWSTDREPLSERLCDAPQVVLRLTWGGWAVASARAAGCFQVPNINRSTELFRVVPLISFWKAYLSMEGALNGNRPS